MNQKTHKPPNPEGRRNSSVSSFKKSLHRCLNLYSKYLLTTHPNKTFNKIVILLFITSCITIFACRERVTPPDTPQYIPPIVLSLEDVSCTDAFIRVKFVDTTIERSFILKRDGATVASVANSPFDTMLIDENLLPKRIYRYKAYRVKGGASVDSSIELKIETMDTTSHEFTWQIDTLGTHSSVLYDVAIINDTLAYAVGEIYHRDSSESYTFFNLAKWNGRQWTLQRLYYQGNTIMHLRWILAFNERDIWVNSITHWNGVRWEEVAFDPIFYGVSTNKAWGTSSSDFYVVGNGGFIAHYDGARWRRLESGTTLDVYDIWGAKNHRTGETEIYAVAAKQFVTFDKRILKVTPMGVSVVSDSNIPYSLHGVWFKAGGPYYVVGSGMYRKRDLMRPDPWQWLHPGVTPYYTYAIRGNNVNDVFICGSYGELLHFNGIHFRSYQNTPGFYFLEFYELSCRNNLVIAVGYVQPRAVAVIGRRTP